MFKTVEACYSVSKELSVKSHEYKEVQDPVRCVCVWGGGGG